MRTAPREVKAVLARQQVAGSLACRGKSSSLPGIVIVASIATTVATTTGIAPRPAHCAGERVDRDPIGVALAAAELLARSRPSRGSPEGFAVSSTESLAVMTRFDGVERHGRHHKSTGYERGGQDSPRPPYPVRLRLARWRLRRRHRDRAVASRAGAANGLSPAASRKRKMPGRYRRL